MSKVDLKKKLKHLYAPSTKAPVIVDVPDMNFLMVDGEGDPNTAIAYREALEVLYAVSYALKFAFKKGEAAVDYAVMPLEGLWWTRDMSHFDLGRKQLWQWTAMIMQPDFVTADHVEAAKAQAARKKALPARERTRFERFREGEAAQILPIGPYADETPTIARLHQFIAGRGLKARGKHHEIYLSDPRRTDPAKLRTIIRQPVG